MNITEHKAHIIHLIENINNDTVLDSIESLLIQQNEIEIPLEVQQIVLERKEYALKNPENLISWEKAKKRLGL